MWFVRFRALDLSPTVTVVSFTGSPAIACCIKFHDIVGLGFDGTDLLSVRILFALRFVISLPVFVSAAAAKSGVSASDPDTDISECELAQPSWHESNGPTVMVALTT